MRRSLVEARRAYSFSETHGEDVARQLSEAAHRIVASQPKGALASAGWSESGHNEEMTHLSARLMLRGGVEGMMVSLSLLSVANAVGWPASFSVPLALVLTVCWAACAACREGLDSVTYSQHYARERSREAWGARPRAENPPPPVPSLVSTPCTDHPERASSAATRLRAPRSAPQSWPTSPRARWPRWCSSTPRKASASPPRARWSRRWPCTPVSLMPPVGLEFMCCRVPCVTPSRPRPPRCRVLRGHHDARGAADVAAA